MRQNEFRHWKESEIELCVSYAKFIDCQDALVSRNKRREKSDSERVSDRKKEKNIERYANERRGA